MENSAQIKWQPVHRCNEGMINTLDGAFSLVSPDPAMIKPKNMAKALSQQIRFSGQLHEEYNNAQHSVFVMLLSPPKLHKPALMHDASHEPYTGDINKPMKMLIAKMAGFDVVKAIEKGIEDVVCKKLGMLPSSFELIKQYDLQATELEQAAFQRGDRAMWDKMWMDAFGYSHSLWSAEYAEQVFIREFERLFGKEALNG